MTVKSNNVFDDLNYVDQIDAAGVDGYLNAYQEAFLLYLENSTPDDKNTHNMIEGLYNISQYYAEAFPDQHDGVFDDMMEYILTRTVDKLLREKLIMTRKKMAKGRKRPLTK